MAATHHVADLMRQILSRLGSEGFTPEESAALATVLNPSAALLNGLGAAQAGCEPESLRYVWAEMEDEHHAVAQLPAGELRLQIEKPAGQERLCVTDTASQWVPLIAWHGMPASACTVRILDFELPQDLLRNESHRLAAAKESHTQDQTPLDVIADCGFAAERSRFGSRLLTVRLYIKPEFHNLSSVQLRMLGPGARIQHQQSVSVDCSQLRPVFLRDLNKPDRAVAAALTTGGQVPVAAHFDFEIPENLQGVERAQLIVMPDIERELYTRTDIQPTAFTTDDSRGFTATRSRHKLGLSGNAGVTRGFLLTVGQREQAAEHIAQVVNFKRRVAAEESGGPVSEAFSKAGLALMRGTLCPLVRVDEQAIRQYFWKMVKNCEYDQWRRTSVARRLHGSASDVAADFCIDGYSDSRTTATADRNSSSLVEMLRDFLGTTDLQEYQSFVEEFLPSIVEQDSAHEAIWHAMFHDPEILTIEDAAKKFGVPAGTIRSALSRLKADINAIRRW